MQLDTSDAFAIGSRVRVKASVPIYHHPEHRGQPFNLKDQVGEVVAILTEWQGKPVSANLPIQVKFSKKFKAHFIGSELDRER